ncbi:MAG: putative ABC exporter domain-containing protein [Lachnospiraceae bacterium]|nr:putative ABC exporter domain-containing protein [Lachnospiraceae bacterium]
MSSLAYLYRTSMKNKIKKALKRPATYIAAVFILFYIVMIYVSMGSIVIDFGVDNPKGLATILSLLVFYLIPADMLAYIKRKGVIFQKADVHFIFPSPENPKRVLLAAGMRSFITTAIAAVLALMFGLIYFHVPPVRMVGYMLFLMVLQNLLEGSIMVICYANETIPDQFFTVLKYIFYVLMSVFALVAVYLLWKKGAHLNVLTEYIQLPVIQLIPLVGWAIAVTQFILTGPTLCNVICLVLYLLTIFVLFCYARKMTCTGAYYEDAMSFAEEFAIRKARAQKGEVSTGKKKKYLKKASIEYKGVYGKAIFYRQLLEYKKNRFFIFGWNSLLCLGIGIVIAVVGVRGVFDEFGAGKVFAIPAVVSYILFIFSGYATKWSKELENPYTFLIPDSGIHKLWYATKVEHIRSLVDGCLITLPGAVALGLSPVITILTVLLYMCLIANKLYLNMLSDALLGKMLGSTAKSFLRVLLQGFVILIGIVAAAIGGIALGVEAGFFLMILIVTVITLAAALGASISFERMESLD